MRRLGLLAVMALGLLMAPACDSGGGDSGQEAAAKISGPSVMAPRGKAIYTAQGMQAGALQWSVQGPATIMGPTDQAQVKVRATAGQNGGAFVLSLRPAGPAGATAAAAQRKIKINPYPRFRLVLDTRFASQFDIEDLTGSGTLTMQGPDVIYQRWALHFVGDASTLPAMVPVTITSVEGTMTLNTWTTNENETVTLAFPRAGGGSVGNGGSVLNAGGNRPDCIDVAGGHQGTLRLRADGVQEMLVTIVGP